MKTQVLKIASLFIVLGTCLSLPCFARQDDTPIDKWLNKELDKDPSTNGMRQATIKATKMWDTEMNRVYRHVLGQLTAAQRASLVRSQKAWLTFRDAETKANGQIIYTRQGTMWRLMGDSHQMEAVKARVMQLKAYEQAMSDG